MITCEDCGRPATTLLELHDDAALTTGQVWHDAYKCDDHRDELVEQIRTEAEEALGITIDHMTSLVDGHRYTCDDEIPADVLDRIAARTLAADQDKS